jgi:hypothetical protein
MTWASKPAYMWLAIEAELAVICASAPALKIYFKKSLGGNSYTYPAGQSTSFKKGSGGTAGGMQSLGRGTVVGTGKQGLWDVSVDDEEHGHEEFSAGEKAGTFLHSANHSMA